MMRTLVLVSTSASLVQSEVAPLDCLIKDEETFASHLQPGAEQSMSCKDMALCFIPADILEKGTNQPCLDIDEVKNSGVEDDILKQVQNPETLKICWEDLERVAREVDEQPEEEHEDEEHRESVQKRDFKDFFVAIEDLCKKTIDAHDKDGNRLLEYEEIKGVNLREISDHGDFDMGDEDWGEESEEGDESARESEPSETSEDHGGEL